MDSLGLNQIISKIKPDEIYNLAAQSHVAVSFQIPEYTTDVNAMGCLRLLEIIKQQNKKIRFYQASTSELYGKTLTIPQNEKTKFQPTSPYSISKLYAYWITKYYRDAYNVFACNGILFNHESPRRGETFVTRKITIGLAKIINGQNKFLEVGNLNSLRDWGHAKEYAEMQWLMLQNKKPNDFVISTGKQYSIRDFINICFKHLNIEVTWKGSNLKEVAIIKSFKDKKYKLKKGQTIIKVNKKYFRPTEVNNLLGDSAKAKKELGWKNKINIKELVSEMLDNDLKKYQININ